MKRCSNPIKHQLQYLFFALLFIKPVLNFSWPTATQLRDLETTTLTTEIGYWYLSSTISGIKVSQCNGVWILGGYRVLGGLGASYSGQYFERQYGSLPSHNQINLSMRIYPIDSWDILIGQDDYFEVSFDGKKVWGWAIPAYQNPSLTQICGNPDWNDHPPFTMKITMPHIDSALTFRITSYLTENSDNESLGFRDIVMDFVYQDQPQVTICGISSIALPDKPCPCDATNEYMSPTQSGTCSLCHASCATCSGGLSTQCLTCPAGNRYFKDFQCPQCSSACATCDGGASNQCTSCIAHYFMVNNSCYPTCNPPLYHYEISDITYCETPCPNQYAYWDNTCSTACPYPLLPKIESSFSLCTFPCAKNEYLYWNRTCSTSCEPPYEIVNINTRYFCVWPCAKGQYGYWDNTCKQDCNPPLVKFTTGNPITKGYCAYPCQFDEYLYYNGTCSDKCDKPLVADVKHGRNFCIYPCLLTKYLYFNGTCLDACKSPLSLRVEDGRSYCDYGCTNKQEYLYWNKTCGPCDFPFIRRIEAGKKYCDFDCMSGTEFLYWDGSCDKACSPPLTQRFEGSPIIKYFCTFPCSVNQFLYWNSTCSNECASPFIQRVIKGRKFCDFPCSDPSKFIYWNNSCLSNCPQPFVNRFEGNPIRKFCDFPCSGSTYLFWNDTCLGTCEPPLSLRVADGRKYCDYPCPGQKYLYWDGSCNLTCAFPLASEKQGDFVIRKFCHYPCEKTQYLYWDGTCGDSCNYPHVVGIESDRKTCNFPCLVYEYLYYNGTCGTSCSLPLKERSQSSRNYCDYSCKSNEFLLWNGTCAGKCDPPYVIVKDNDGIQFCNLPCESNYYYFPEDKTCNETCAESYINSTDLPYKQCYSSKIIKPNISIVAIDSYKQFVSLIAPVKMMRYLSYLNVELPSLIKRVSENHGRSMLSTNLGIQPKVGLEDLFERYTSLDELYLKHHLKKDFLTNFWSDLMNLLIFILIGILLHNLEKMVRTMRLELGVLVLERLRIIMKWNFPIMLLATSIDDIVLFAAIEFKTLNSRAYNLTTSTLSFCLCMLLFACLFGLTYLTYYMIKRNSNDDKQRNESVKVLINGFNEDHIVNKMFFVVYMVRIGLPMFVAVCCENQPVVCCLMQILISIGIVRAVKKFKPFKKLINHYQIMIYEVIILVMNIFVGLIIFIQVTGLSYTRLRGALDGFVFGANIFLNVYPVIFLIIKGVFEGFVIYKEMKRQEIEGAKRYIAFLQLLFLPLQQGNMGFEELIDYEPFLKPAVENFKVFPTQNVTENSLLTYESYMKKNLNTRHRKMDLNFDQTNAGDESIHIFDTQKTEEEDSIIPSHKKNALKLRAITKRMKDSNTIMSSGNFTREKDEKEVISKLKIIEPRIINKHLESIIEE